MVTAVIARTMNALTLDQLRVFLAVVDTGSFSAAARELERAQSAVSYAMANLEQLLGVTLFDRSTRRPHLTPAGETLVNDARLVLQHVDHLRARSRGIAEGAEPQLALAVDTLFPLPPLVEGLQTFQAQFPTVLLDLRAEPAEHVAQRVAEGSAQLGLCGPLATLPVTLERRPLTTLLVVTVVASHHVLARESHPSPLALREHVQLLLAGGPEREVLSSRSWPMADAGTAQRYLRAGLGWGNLPYHLVAADLTAGHLVRIHPTAWPEELHLEQDLIYRTAEPPGPAGRWLVEELQTRCRQSAVAGP